jgi:hypothetical protein
MTFFFSIPLKRVTLPYVSYPFRNTSSPSSSCVRWLFAYHRLPTLTRSRARSCVLSRGFRRRIRFLPGRTSDTHAENVSPPPARGGLRRAYSTSVRPSLTKTGDRCTRSPYDHEDGWATRAPLYAARPP